MLEQAHRIKLSERDFERFVTAIDAPKSPAAGLVVAMKEYERQRSLEPEGNWYVMPVVELLQAHHDRKSFDCGKPSLNEFLQKQARQNADRNVGVTHVVIPEPGSSRILGYYTLVTRALESALVPDNKKLPRGSLEVALLGRLAVDKSTQGQGLGKLWQEILQLGFISIAPIPEPEKSSRAGKPPARETDSDFRETDSRLTLGVL